ncbi:metabolite transporter [Heyndrickxia ginsengihumi]|uniref:Metabolite transporter n=1 Tax=Heyndrickxia ginsengihumi TaxID=363870 RepID=A0A0A6VBQ7_9BACI|nr:MFS transporter [Heyndrickxia ginsengihumi]KHD84923.1 metabolite transporter [Heyndrickxia ginsengihumi]
MRLQTIMDEAPFTSFHRKLTIYTCGGPFLDGYILTIIGVALSHMQTQLQLNTFWSAMIGASALAGLLLGGLVFGYITDLVGRHVMYTLDLVAILIFSILQFFVHNAVELTIVRFLMGIAIGADYPIATALLAEFSPKKQRGKMLGILMSTWYLGALVSYIVAYLLLPLGEDAWRWILVSSAVPTFLLLVMRWGTPESPRWLASKKRFKEANEVIQEVYGVKADVSKMKDEKPVKTNFRKMFQGEYLKRTLFIGLFWTFQIIPTFAIYTFGPQILEAFHLKGENVSFLSEIFISLFFLIGCIPALFFVNKIGRRPVIIWSFVMMTVGMFILGIFPNSSIWVILLGFALYAFFSGGPSVLDYIYPNELFPTEIRASAVGMGTAFSRIGSFVGTFLLPYSLNMVGIAITMLIGGGLTILGLLVSIAWAPETKGKTLAEASSVEQVS